METKTRKTNMQNSTHNSWQITNDYDALVLALRLAINAPNDETSKKCVLIAEGIAHNLNESEVSKAKIEALTTNEEI
tara:strand:+ start:1169 stop:1399 length:231 start_codon:yes stop_codon:yes gene_type:complete